MWNIATQSELSRKPFPVLFLLLRFIWSSYLYFQWRIACWLLNFDDKLHDLGKSCRFILRPVLISKCHLAEVKDKGIDDQGNLNKNLFSGLTKLDFKITSDFQGVTSEMTSGNICFWSAFLELMRSYKSNVLDLTVQFHTGVDHRTLRWSKRKPSLSLRIDSYRPQSHVSDPLAVWMCLTVGHVTTWII